MSYHVLLITKGKSPLKTSVSQFYEITSSNLTVPGDFKKIPPSIKLILIDLENEPDLINLLLVLRNYSPLQGVPRWGCMDSPNIKLRNLFFSFGGNKIIKVQEILPAMKEYLPSSNTSGKSSMEETIPSTTPGAMNYRITEHLHFTNLKKCIAGLDTTNLNSTMAYILEQIFLLTGAHLGVIIVNNTLKVESYVKPDKLIFKEDYTDFMNFCLNDFFTYFQGVNLEDISENFFLEGRKNFHKIGLQSQKISSYIYFPLFNQKGDVEATLHLGHLRNNYFSDKMIEMVESFINTIKGSFFYSLRSHQLNIRQEKILNIFSRFVPEEIIPELINKESEKASTEVEQRDITILFSDIRSFTTITEKNSAQNVVDFLNRHFDIMVGIIKKYGGSIDKFIGDAIVAMFGAPQNFEDNSARAIKAAIEMSHALYKVDCSNLILEGNHYNLGIGIHDGPAIIGNIGSTEKADYTAIGDVIGIAEELEATTKKYGVHVLVSEEAAKKAGESVRLEQIDIITIRNEAPMKIFTPVIRNSYD